MLGQASSLNEIVFPPTMQNTYTHLYRKYDPKAHTQIILIILKGKTGLV